MEAQIHPVRYDHPDVVMMTAEVQAEYARRYGDGGDVSPISPVEFLPPDGRFVVAYVDDFPAAMGGWRRGGPDGSTDAEVKRMYVRPGHARRGLARLVLAELERTAAAAGVTRLVLETGTAQPEAIALYESSGFEHISAFGFYADYDDSVHLAKALG